MQGRFGSLLHERNPALVQTVPPPPTPLRQTQLLLRPQLFGGLLHFSVPAPQTQAHLQVVGLSAAPAGQLATQAPLQQVNPAGQEIGTQVCVEPSHVWHVPQLAVVRHWTQAPLPSQTVPPFWLHAVPAAAFVWLHVLVLIVQASAVQGLPSSHWLSAVQQPAMPSRPQVPLVQVAVLQVGGVPQSAASQHCWQVPPQSRVPLGQAQAPLWQVMPPLQQVAPHSGWPAGHWHVPAWHVLPPVQTSPNPLGGAQSPQLALSLLVSMHVPPQSDFGSGHMQRVSEVSHTFGSGHSVSEQHSTAQVPSAQSCCPSGQPVWQCPSRHRCPTPVQSPSTQHCWQIPVPQSLHPAIAHSLLQTWSVHLWPPHSPSSQHSTQSPVPQESICPAGQVHVPPVQMWPPVQSPFPQHPTQDPSPQSFSPG